MEMKAEEVTIRILMVTFCLKLGTGRHEPNFERSFLGRRMCRSKQKMYRIHNSVSAGPKYCQAHFTSVI